MSAAARARAGKKPAPARISPAMRTLLALLSLLTLVSSARAVCVGDCSGDDEVAINELIVGVGIALGSDPVSACRSLDANDDGTVSIGELVSGVNNALSGCVHDATPTESPSTPESSPTATAPPTVTPTPAMGPEILWFAVTNADDSYLPPSATDPSGIPIYERAFGFGFSLVIEARHGSSNRPVADMTFIEGDTPDLQVQSSRPLGNGSTAVCDGESPNFGGVPAVDPPQLEDPGAIADALNDLGCRFIDGQGKTEGRICQQGCVRFETGEYGCQMGDEVELQFCAPVPMASLAFPVGDTMLTARVRDQAGNLGAPARLIVRVAAP